MKYLTPIILIGILLNGGIALAQVDTIDEAKQVGEQLLDDSPSILNDAWQGIKGALRTVWGYLEKIFRGIFKAIWSVLGKEVEQRRPDIEKEFQNEVEEMKEDIPKTGKTLWERLKDLFK